MAGPAKDGGSGRDGANGKSAYELALSKRATLAQNSSGLNRCGAQPASRAQLGRVGKDGRDGRDGKDGDAGRDALAIDILPAIDEAKSYPRGTFAEHRGGIIRAIRNTDPITDDGLEKAGWVVSMNGIDRESEETLDDGRTIRRTTQYTSGRMAGSGNQNQRASVPRGMARGRIRARRRGDLGRLGVALPRSKTTDKPGNFCRLALDGERGCARQGRQN